MLTAWLSRRSGRKLNAYAIRARANENSTSAKLRLTEEHRPPLSASAADQERETIPRIRYNTNVIIALQRYCYGDRCNCPFKHLNWDFVKSDSQIVKTTVQQAICSIFANLDEYEVSVSSTSGKIYLNPYTAGLGYVKLYAKEFVSIDAETIVNDASASVSVWADIAGTNSTAHDWIRLTGDDVTGAGQPVIGQKTTLTVYVGGNHTASDIRINGQTATRLTSGTGRSISLGSPAETFNAYYIEYRPEIGDSRTDRIKVTVGGTLCATFEVGVWGMEVSEEPLRNTTHEIYQAGHYYTFVNRNQTDYHLYATELSANISGRLTADNPYDYNSLFGFDNTSNSVKVRVPSKKGFVAGAKSSKNSAVTLSISDGGTAYSLAYSNSGIQLRNNFNNTNYNWYQSNGTAAMILPTNNNRGNVSTFNVYSVRLLRP